MSKADLLGKIAFINHEKKYAMIEYEQNGKKKTVKGNIDEKVQKDQKEKKLIKKMHHFLMGDVVSFKLKATEKGDRMAAANINFLYNNALEVLINQAITNNKFTGYLKAADHHYFVKEIDSYLFFPVKISPWQILPSEDELNEPLTFCLENLDKKDKISASLLNNEYIPQFSTAVKLYKAKTPVTAEVYKVSPFAVYLNVVEDKIQAKIALDKLKNNEGLKPGDKLDVVISYLSKTKIVVEQVAERVE
jgi:hypothetical protein